MVCDAWCLICDIRYVRYGMWDTECDMWWDDMWWDDMRADHPISSYCIEDAQARLPTQWPVTNESCWFWEQLLRTQSCARNEAELCTTPPRQAPRLTPPAVCSEPMFGLALRYQTRLTSPKRAIPHRWYSFICMVYAFIYIQLRFSFHMYVYSCLCDASLCLRQFLFYCIGDRYMCIFFDKCCTRQV